MTNAARNGYPRRRKSRSNAAGARAETGIAVDLKLYGAKEPFEPFGEYRPIRAGSMGVDLSAPNCEVTAVRRADGGETWYYPLGMQPKHWAALTRTWWDEQKVYRNWGNPEIMTRKRAGFTGAGSV